MNNVKHVNMKLSTVAVGGVFALGILITPALAHAQTAQSGGATSSNAAKINKATLGKSKTECIGSISAIRPANMSALKSYGDKRFEKRRELLQKYVSRVDTRYKSVEKNKDTKKKNTARIAKNKKLTTYEAGTSSPTVNKDTLVNEVKGAIGQVDNLKGQFNKANNPSEAADPLCSLVYDQKIFSYFSNKIIQQRRIDTLSISLNENKTRIENYKKAEQKGAKNAQVIRDLDKALAETNGNIAKLQGVQNNLNAIQKDTLPAVNEQGHAIKSAELFNQVWGAEGKKSYQSFAQQVKSQTTNVGSFNKRVKTKKPRSNQR